MMKKYTLLRRYTASLKTAVMAGLTLIVAVGCSDLLDVRDPDIVTPEDLSGEAGLATRRAGALSDIAVALSGSAAGHGATPGLVLMSGAMTDELRYSGTFPTRREADQRVVARNNSTMSGVFDRLHRARNSLSSTAEALETLSASPTTDPRIAEMWNLNGYLYTIFGETFCSGTPFSTAGEDGSLNFGSPMSTTDMFQAAIGFHDQALSNTGGSADQGSLASVLKARALLNMGQFGAAAAEVAGVPTGFVFNIEHSLNSTRQQNGIFILSTIRRQYSVPDDKGGIGLMFRSSNDPRVPWDDPGVNGQDDQTPYFNQLKYPDEAAPLPIATGIEARLIEAEDALQNADAVAFQDIHNTLRATMGLAPIDATTMTATEMEDFHFSERAFWLWSTLHRQGDLRRLVRQYGRGTETVFPTGAYPKGGSYGADVTLPIPVEEDNNPNFTGCIDRDA